MAKTESRRAKSPAPVPVPWNSMSAAKRRVAVAKDVLAQLAARKIEVVEGRYLELPDEVLPDLESSAQLHECLPKMDRCLVCARGAAFLSSVRLFNKTRFDDVAAHPDLAASQGSLRLFGTRQAGMIEAAFELAYSASAETAALGRDTFLACREFGEQFDEPVDRLRAIMRNIIENGGTFRPGKGAT